jgi:hypothetical protein
MAQSSVRTMVEALRDLAHASSELGADELPRTKLDAEGPAELDQEVPAGEAFDVATEFAMDAYASFLEEANPSDCRELQAVCSSDLGLARAWWDVFSEYNSHDWRFSDSATDGWTVVLGVALDVEATRFSTLLPLPASARRALRRHLEDTSQFPGDIHLSTVALMLPIDTLNLPPEMLFSMVVRTTSGQEIFRAGGPEADERLVELDEPTPFKLVVFATAHLAVEDLPADQRPQDWDEFNRTWMDIGVPGTPFKWDLTSLLGCHAYLNFSWEAPHALGEACIGDMAHEMTDSVIDLLNSAEPPLEDANVLLRCVPAQEEMEGVGGRGYEIAVELRNGETVLSRYEVGPTLSPAYAIGFLHDRIQLMRPGAVVKLSQERY